MQMTPNSLDVTALAMVQGGMETVWSQELGLGGTGATVTEARMNFLANCQKAGKDLLKAENAMLA